MHDGQGAKNDDGSYTLPPKTIQVNKFPHDLTVENVMLFSSAIVSVDEVQVYIFTQVNGKKSGGSLLSFLPNSAGESKARVNPKMVRDFNLEDADITFTNQVNVTSTRQVRVYSVFNLSLTNTALGGKSVVLPELIVLVTTHDKNGTEHRHDQHYTLNYTKTQGKYSVCCFIEVDCLLFLNKGFYDFKLAYSDFCFLIAPDTCQSLGFWT